MIVLYPAKMTILHLIQADEGKWSDEWYGSGALLISIKEVFVIAESMR